MKEENTSIRKESINMKIAFIGAGKMATAIVKGMLDKDVICKNDITAADISAGSRHFFTETTGISCHESALEIIENAEIIILAIKPQVIEEAVVSIAGKCSGKRSSVNFGAINK